MLPHFSIGEQTNSLFHSLLQKLHTPIAGVLDSHFDTLRVRFADTAFFSYGVFCARAALAFKARALAFATVVLRKFGLSSMGSETPNDTVLLLAHRDALVVTEIQEELEIPNSTVSHHLEKLRGEGLVVRRLTRCTQS